MDALKNMFNQGYYQHLASVFYSVEPKLNYQKLLKDFISGIETLSLNERLRHTTLVMKAHLPAHFPDAIKILDKVVPQTRGGYTNLIFPDYVAQFGLQYFEESMKALKNYTGYGSSEFAIRVFLKHDLKRTLEVMKNWAKDNNAHIRRLASEGCRPRLPWSFKLEAIVRQPEHTKVILNTLKTDKDLYVKKSVANHLNDISKDNPEYMLELVKSWNLENADTAWIVKHASRGLIKKGHAGSLEIFKFEKNPKVKIANFKLESKRVKLGEQLNFSFGLSSEKNKTQKLVVDYIIHYQKKSGALSPKVFKLKEVYLEGNKVVLIQKKQWIKDFTTRKHEAGTHILEIQVNGKVLVTKKFEIILN